MPFLIFFLVISLPVIEVASIVEVSRLAGPLAAFLLLAGGVAFGMFLIRSQSTIMARRALEAMQAGAPPEQHLLDSGSVMLAGALFIIPGFFTDFLALLLLLPVARRLIWGGLSYGIKRRSFTAKTSEWSSTAPKPQRSEDVIDVEFTEVPPDAGEGAGRKDSPWGKS
jgi:UPF0716 protein FxsA